MGLDFFLDVMQRLLGFATTFQERSRYRSQLKDHALTMIFGALHSTLVYYRGLDSGAKRDLETEAELSELWGKAAIPMRHLNSELSMICAQKSAYWISPERWTKKQIRNAKIELDGVFKRYLSVLPDPPYARRFSFPIRRSPPRCACVKHSDLICGGIRQR